MPPLFSSAPLIPMQLKPAVDAELESGEKVLWFAQPNPRTYARASIAIVIFGIFWTGFALFWTGGAALAVTQVGPGMIFFPLFGLPFIAIGIFMLSSPYWLRRKAARTFYLLTDRRAVIAEAGFFSGQTVHSFRPERLTSIIRTERPDGSGDLIFEQFTTRHGSGYSTTRRGFIGIADVRDVERLINALIDHHRAQRDAQ